MSYAIKLSRRAFLASTAVLAPAIAQASTLMQAGELYRDAAAPTEARIADLLARMTLEEKAAQLSCLLRGKAALLGEDGSFSGSRASSVLADGIGQVARPGDTNGSPEAVRSLFRTGPDTVRLVNAIQHFLVEQTRLGIPAIFHEETAHGLAVAEATVFPSPLALGSTWDPDLVQASFAVVGREARARGVTLGLGPVLDLARDPRFGRVEECFGEDPVHVGKMGLAAVLGQQGAERPLGRDKIFVTLKHFIHGSPEGGINTAPADFSDRTLNELYLRPFAHVIRAVQPGAVMPSYNEVQGVPAHANRRLLTKIGREQLGFTGPYLSDYSAIVRLADPHHVSESPADSAILALRAGVDADLPNGEVFATLPALVRNGRVPEQLVDAAVIRILRLKFEAGLFENPYVDEQRAVLDVNTATDIRLARIVAQKAVVLLKNDGVLPLDPDAALKLAVIGPNAATPMFGNYSGSNSKAVAPLDGIKAAAGPRVVVEYAEGVRLTEDVPGDIRPNLRPMKLPEPGANLVRIEDAKAVAERADVIVLIVGDNSEVTRESIREFAPGDRSSLNLFGDQDALVEAMIATGRPIVAVLLNGRPLAVTRLADNANALLEGWYLGQEGGNALADILFGLTNPGGKLPVMIPRSTGSLPVHSDAHASALRYRYIDDDRGSLFPLGFGLSYTAFDLSAPRLLKDTILRGESASIEVDLKNSGSRRGDEVVQLYIRDEVSSAPRPVLELKSFQRVTMEASETRTLRFELKSDDLAFWDIDMNWTVEPGLFTILVGVNSVDLQAVQLTVA